MGAVGVPVVEVNLSGICSLIWSRSEGQMPQSVGGDQTHQVGPAPRLSGRGTLPRAARPARVLSSF